MKIAIRTVGRFTVAIRSRWVWPKVRRIGPFPGMNLRWAWQVGPFAGMIWARKPVNPYVPINQESWLR